METAETKFKLKRLKNVFWAAEIALTICLIHRVFILPNEQMAITFLLSVLLVGFAYIPIYRGRLEIATTLHKALLELCRNGDKKRAASHLKKHIVKAKDDIKKLLASNEH